MSIELDIHDLFKISVTENDGGSWMVEAYVCVLTIADIPIFERIYKQSDDAYQGCAPDEGVYDEDHARDKFEIEVAEKLKGLLS